MQANIYELTARLIISLASSLTSGVEVLPIARRLIRTEEKAIVDIDLLHIYIKEEVVAEHAARLLVNLNKPVTIQWHKFSSQGSHRRIESGQQHISLPSWTEHNSQDEEEEEQDNHTNIHKFSSLKTLRGLKSFCAHRPALMSPSSSPQLKIGCGSALKP